MAAISVALAAAELVVTLNMRRIAFDPRVVTNLGTNLEGWDRTTRIFYLSRAVIDISVSAMVATSQVGTVIWLLWLSPPNSRVPN